MTICNDLPQEIIKVKNDELQSKTLKIVQNIDVSKVDTQGELNPEGDEDAIETILQREERIEEDNETSAGEAPFNKTGMEPSISLLKPENQLQIKSNRGRKHQQKKIKARRQ
ncbi:MAG: hypothetical protein EZS28_017173 [Streblomastix strix]|uniref:Uncharacterized protein n=1 Tax=Streblomastix strix TaxID=222440 RepID=A0A5J4VXD5_9EUKA|nr:MAG: hypothetical protein EZS28_017173 [Streblomastix strix]